MTIHSSKMIVLGGRVRDAQVVRSLAGRTAGWGTDSGGRRGSRRGATLILIIGALALISVVILGYFLVGKADRRTGAVAVRRDYINATADRMASYIATDVIGNDVFSVYVEGKNPDLANPFALLVREGWDYPWTDPQRRSEPVVFPGTESFDRQRFDPTGTIPRSFTPVFDGADPTKNNQVLPFPGSDPWLAMASPVWLNPTINAPRYKENPPNTYDSELENRRDLGQVSDIAPDGRFVNLFNLRGNFEAESGITLSTNGVGTRISDNLTLMDANGKAAYPLGKQELDYSNNYGNGAMIADANTPSHWNQRQQAAFRPVGSAGLLFTDPAYPDYQWVDTDGDGLYDARWCELVDASLPLDPLNPGADARSPVSLLPQDGRYRWFIAAKIVDLSGLVNVNVATDLSLNPANPGDAAFGVSKDYPVGLSPSDIDLRTPLTLANGRMVYALPDLKDGYAQLKQGAGFDDYTLYSNDKNQPPPTAFAAGAGGYQGIGATIGQVLTPRGDQDLTGLPPLSAKARYDYYRLSGGFLPGEAGFDLGAKAGTITGIFGLPDQIELLTYRGRNDPANRSRLETAVGGREFNTPYTRFSPLRDNRSGDVERAVAAGQYGQADLATLMWSALDARQSLTTLSGGRPLRSGRLYYNVGNPGGDTGLRATAGRIDGATNELPTDAVAALRTAEVGKDPSFVFHGYCDALLPFSADHKAWDPAPSSPYLTMAYGHNTEAAIRIAAAMTVNQIDLNDADNIPIAVTLLLDGSGKVNQPEDSRGTVAGDAVKFPWWSEGKSGRLDLDDGQPTDGNFPDGNPDDPRRLTGNTAYLASPSTTAINVFGVEAQPFVTEVATFNMYTDSPTGDNDYTNTPITINGAVSTGNHDFIMQCVAFELNNPFDVAIDLTDNYYIEFGTRTILANKNINIIELLPSGAQQAVSLQAHETKVFYMLSQPRVRILARMKVVEPAVDAASVDNWIANQLDVQFGAATPAVQIPSVNGPAQPFGVEALLASTPADKGPAADNNREFRLWRILRSAVDNAGANDTANDLLVDRLRDPGDQVPTLDTRLPDANISIVGTNSKDKGKDDDTGYSITTWGWIGRPEDPTDPDAGGIVPRGALPAWCVERKYGASLNKNDKLPQDPNLAALNKIDFANPNADITFKGLIDAQGPPGNVGTDLVKNLQTTEEQKGADFPSDVIPANTAPKNGNVPYYSLYPEAHLNNNDFKNADGLSVLRPADMLLALGVSPWYDPNGPLVDGADTQKIGNDRWTTLGESLAMALGYNDPPNDPGHAPFYDLYHKTDRASLRLDAFVPFVDSNTNGTFDPAAPDFEERRGGSIPLALNIFDVFSTLDPQFGSLNRPTVGVINANTATENVLRSVPMLSPPDDVDFIGSPSWFWPDPSPLSTKNAPVDIASTVVSYRDKSRVMPRGDVKEVGFVGSTGIPGYYNPDPAANPPEYYGRDTLVADYPAKSHTGIHGNREQPGFANKGELMAARDLQYENPGTPTPGKHDIDKLGADKAALGPGKGSIDRAGVDSVRYAGDTDDQIQDDYDEKLAIANGVMNSVSVRSDLFAATFVIRGYQKSDCEGLTDRDPLVPSIARRYLMIVDRSNVVKTGDRPRILVFKELPLR